MCIVSMIGDGWRKSVPDNYPWINPYKTIDWPPSAPSKEEFEKLKKEVEELKKLLYAAKQFDKNTGQPNCELDEKVKFLKQVADFVGVDLKDILYDNKR